MKMPPNCFRFAGTVTAALGAWWTTSWKPSAKTQGEDRHRRHNENSLEALEDEEHAKLQHRASSSWEPIGLFKRVSH